MFNKIDDGQSPKEQFYIRNNISLEKCVRYFETDCSFSGREVCWHKAGASSKIFFATEVPPSKHLGSTLFPSFPIFKNPPPVSSSSPIYLSFSSSIYFIFGPFAARTIFPTAVSYLHYTRNQVIFSTTVPPGHENLSAISDGQHVCCGVRSPYSTI